jgi:ABC-type iron transport system FetAB permease component
MSATIITDNWLPVGLIILGFIVMVISLVDNKTPKKSGKMFWSSFIAMVIGLILLSYKIFVLR